MGLLLLLKNPSSGTPLDIRAKVGVSSSPTVTGNQAITGVGFQPKAVLPFGTAMITNGSDTTLLHNFGALTASQNACVSIRSARNVTASQAARHHSSTNAVCNIDGTFASLNISASRQSLDADGFTLNYTALDGVSRILNHICLGGADFEVSLTQHQLNGTNSPQAFPHGLGGPPTGLLMFHAGNNALPPNTASVLSYGVGAWAGGSQWASRAYSNNGVTTTETRRELRNDCWYTGGTTTTTRTSAVSSVDATNVNVTYPVASSIYQSYVWMLAIRGAKCQTGTFDCNGSTSPLTIPCSGITPKLFLPVFVPSGVSSINTVINQAHLAIGASDGVGNVSCGVTDQDGVTTTNTRRHQSSSTLAEYGASTGSLLFEATAAFSGQSVVMTPTTYGLSSMGQGAYLIIGA